MKLYDALVLPLIEAHRGVMLETGTHARIEVTLEHAVFLALLEERSFDLSYELPTEVNFGPTGVVIKDGGPGWRRVLRATREA